MMSQVKIIRHNYYDYRVSSFSSPEIEMLGDFLANDIVEDIDGALEAITEPEKYCFPGELFLASVDNNEVVISPELAGTMTIKIPKDTFVEIIKKWDRIIKTNPKKIIITEEKGKYNFDAEYWYKAALCMGR